MKQKRELVNDIFNRHLLETNNPKSISEAYHKAKADGSNPVLVKAVEDLISPKIKENVSKNIEGVSGQIGEGKESIQAQPIESGGVEAISGSRGVQAQEKSKVGSASYQANTP